MYISPLDKGGRGICKKRAFLLSKQISPQPPSLTRGGDFMRTFPLDKGGRGICFILILKFCNAYLS